MQSAADYIAAALAEGAGSYRKLVINAEDKLVGMIFLGDIDKAGVYFGLMRDRIPVTAFKKKLLAGATAGQDFVAQSGTVTFTNGQTSAVFAAEILDAAKQHKADAIGMSGLIYLLSAIALGVGVYFKRRR